MNKLFQFVIASLLTVPAFAAVTTFNCELEKYPKQIVTFRIAELGTPKMQYVSIDPNDEYSGVFATRSKNETIVRLVDTLNGQGGDLRFDNQRLSFFGDSAGIDFAYLDLFRNTGYRNGFVRINFNFGNDQDYSRVRCNLK